jgi:hypothetical protein
VKRLRDDAAGTDMILRNGCYAWRNMNELNSVCGRGLSPFDGDRWFFPNFVSHRFADYEAG